LTDLVARSTSLYPDLARELEDLTGVSIELRVTGLLRLALDEKDEEDVRRSEEFRSARRLPSERLEARDARSLGRAISEEGRSLLYERDVAQVRNPRLLRALVSACDKRGVALLPHEPVIDLLRAGERIAGVRTARRRLSSGEVVLAAGAWSGELARTTLGLDLAVAPVRGQMLLVLAPPGALSCMVLGAGGRYLIPRADGQILCGSTLEHVGFDRRTTLEGVSSLLHAALRLAPGLAHARLEIAWAGLRPATPDRLPFLGRARGLEGLVFATGHYRNGLVLAPVTAEIVSEVVLGRAPRVDLAPFAPGRPVS
jgi:glycine oxidase